MTVVSGRLIALPGLVIAMVLGGIVPGSGPGAPRASAQHDHATAGSSSGQAGQAAFAALAAVVRALQADETTDWSRVDLGALRAHLVDMDALVLRAVVEEEPLVDGLSMTINGEAARDAARRMLPAHGRALEADRGWRTELREGNAGTVVFSVRGVAPRDLDFVRGLGFFGILALGEHHDAHHLMIARGVSH